MNFEMLSVKKSLQCVAVNYSRVLQHAH